MAIVDYTYYTDTYLGEPIAETAFPRYEARAEDLIAQITRGADFDSLPSAFQTLYQKAICAQVEYFVLQGISVATEGANTGDTSYTIGKISVGRGGSGSSAAASGGYSMIAPAARGYLEQTGLLSRHVDTLDVRNRWWW